MGVELSVEAIKPADLGASERALWQGFVQASPELASPYFDFRYALAAGDIAPHSAVAVIHRQGRIEGFLPFQRRGSSPPTRRRRDLRFLPLGRSVCVGAGGRPQRLSIIAVTWPFVAILTGDCRPTPPKSRVDRERTDVSDFLRWRARRLLGEERPVAAERGALVACATAPKR